MKKLVSLLCFTLAFIGIAQDSYTLNAESVMTISGTSTVHDWTVNANSMTAILEGEATTLKAISFEVNVADIQSERGPTMDTKMHAALKSEIHPKILFELQEHKDQATLTGLVIIAGQEKQIEIDAITMATDNGVQITGEQQITLQDFGIEPPTAMFGQIIVGDVVTVSFDLMFTTQ